MLSVLNINEKRLDSETLKLCQYINLKTWTGCSCRRVLFQYVFQSGPYFYWNGKPTKPTFDFQNIINRYWIPFCKDVVDCILTLGLVPIKLLRLPKNQGGITVPFVYKGIMGVDYNITVINDDGKLDYLFYKPTKKTEKTGMSIGQMKRTKKVSIWGGFGYDPSSDGTLNSITSTIVPQFYFLNRMYHYTLRSEYNRSDPSLITQISSESAGVSKKMLETVQYSTYGDMDVNEFQNMARYRLNRQVKIFFSVKK